MKRHATEPREIFCFAGANQDVRDHSGKKARQYLVSQEAAVSQDTFRSKYGSPRGDRKFLGSERETRDCSKEWRCRPCDRITNFRSNLRAITIFSRSSPRKRDDYPRRSVDPRWNRLEKIVVELPPMRDSRREVSREYSLFSAS